MAKAKGVTLKDPSGNAIFPISDATFLQGLNGKTVAQNLQELNPSSPYTVTVGASGAAWTGSVGNFTYTISAATHGKGQYPIVRTFSGSVETNDNPTIDASGNVTVKSNSNIQILVVIQ